MKRILSLLLAAAFAFGCAAPAYADVSSTPETAAVEVTATPQPSPMPAAELEPEVKTVENAVLDTENANNDVTAFVTRLYQVCLNRTPDQAGLNDWVSGLKSGKNNGAATAAGFVFSKEFKGMNLCNDCFVTYMYKAFFDRSPDKSGYDNWVNQLNQGRTRGEIFGGFVGSQEFTNLCARYGITRGDGDWSGNDFKSAGVCASCGKDSTAQITAFVTRLYQVCLDRTPDQSGLGNWVSGLISGQNNGAATAAGFIFSKEFTGKNLCNKHYVMYLYRAFFGREADQGGLNNWTTLLSGGHTRGEVFNGFIGSDEFTKMCAEYGITRGNGDWAANNPAPTGNCSICGVPSSGTPSTEYVNVVYNWNNGPLWGVDCDNNTRNYIVGLMTNNGALKVKSGTKFSDLSIPASTGDRDIFLGWYIDKKPSSADYNWRSTGGTKVDANTVFTQDTEIYAHWKYNVTEDIINELFSEVVDKYMPPLNRIIKGIPGYNDDSRVWTNTTEQAMLNINDRELKIYNPVDEWARINVWKICDTNDFSQYASLRAYIHMAAQSIAMGTAGELSHADSVIGETYAYPSRSEGNYAFVKTNVGYALYFIECAQLNSYCGDWVGEGNDVHLVLKQEIIDCGAAVRDRIRLMPEEWVWNNR